LRQIQILPLETPLVARVEPNSPASLGKLKRNDIILAVNGIKLYNPLTITDEIRRAPDRAVTLRVKRGREEFETVLKPVLPVGWKDNPNVPEELRHPQLGIAWEANGLLDIDHPQPLEQIRASIISMASTLGAVLSRKSD